MYGWMFKIQHVLWLGACRACLGERAICVFAKNLTIGSVDYNSTLLMTCSYLDLSVVYQCYPCWTQVHVTTLLLSMMWPILISEVHKIKHVTNSWHYSLLGGGGTGPCSYSTAYPYCRRACVTSGSEGPRLSTLLICVQVYQCYPCCTQVHHPYPWWNTSFKQTAVTSYSGVPVWPQAQKVLRSSSSELPWPSAGVPVASIVSVYVPVVSRVSVSSLSSLRSVASF